MRESLIRISVPWATFGLIARNGRIVQAAPICRWATGKDAEDVMRNWRRRGATVEVLR